MRKSPVTARKTWASEISAWPIAHRRSGMIRGNGFDCGPQIIRTTLIMTNATPMVVIMGAVPDTPRTGRRQIRSIRTPRSPVSSIVTGKTSEQHPDQRQAGQATATTR